MGGNETLRRELDRTIAGLPKRTFVLSSTKEKRPVVFSTRWVLSYLKGPLTRDDIRRLQPRTETPAPEHGKRKAAAPAAGTETATIRPETRFRIEEAFLDTAAPNATAHFTPTLAAEVSYRFFLAAKGIDLPETERFILPIAQSDTLSWRDAETLDALPPAAATVRSGATYDPLPDWLMRLRTDTAIRTALKHHLYGERTLVLRRCPSLRLDADALESESAFAERIRNELERRFDEADAKLRERYAKKERTLRGRLERAEAKLRKEEADVERATTDSLLGFGMALFDLFSGGSRVRSSASRGIRKGRRAVDERRDVREAQEKVDTLLEALEALENEYAGKREALREKFAPHNHPVKERLLKPRKSDIRVGRLILLWQA
jgi:hypothetical protein